MVVNTSECPSSCWITDVLTGLGPLDCEGVRQPDPASPGLKILFMKFSHQFDLMLQIGEISHVDFGDGSGI
jgi:hypothetical protein